MKIIYRYFVPNHLGPGHISREEIIQNHTTTYAKVFYGHDSLIFVWDATYFFIEKSGCHAFQRDTFSMQKGCNLLKMMSIVCTDKHVVDTVGPYGADYYCNDGMLAKDILETEEKLVQEYGKGDDRKVPKVSVLDRGFRDGLEAFEENNMESHMPAFKPKGESQLSVQDANETRLVTKVRNPVEGYHGELKSIWPFLKFDIPNCLVPYIGPCVRIGSAALNCFRYPGIEYNMEDEAEALAMLAKARETRNPLADKIMFGDGPVKLSSRSKQQWTPMEAAEDLGGFPKLTEQDIRRITFGPYQIRMAQHYAAEHINQNGDFVFEVSKLNNDIVRCQIQSRHQNSVKYKLAVQFTESAITGYCCSCTPGKRTVGCCSHIATVIWYLGFGRFQAKALPSEKHAKKMQGTLRKKPRK